MHVIKGIPGAVNFKDVRDSLTKKGSYSTRLLSNIKYLVIHHSATTSGSAESYARYHVNTNGWPGIAYHLVIEQDGTVKWTNNLENKSYHVGNSNGVSVGVALTGDFTKQNPTEGQWQSLYATIRYLRQVLDIEIVDLRGHQEMPGYSWKQCPALDMDAMRGEVAAGTERPVKASFNNDQTIEVDTVVTRTPVAPSPKPIPISNDMPEFVTVQPGDTLYGIALNRANLTVDEILRLNPGLDPRALQVGQQIRIKPVGETYVIQRGDTLWGIANKNPGVSVSDIQRANPNLDPRSLVVGSVIRIPSGNKEVIAKPAPVAPKPTKPILVLPTGILRNGDHGTGVKQLQECLNAAYFNCGTPDGMFGNRTEDAVERFQSMYRELKADGVYGPNTRTKLKEKLGL